MLDREQICTMIKWYRKKCGMTQEQLAKTIQVDRTYICAIEKGRRFPSWEVMNLLINALDMKEEDLFHSVHWEKNMVK